MTVIPEDLPYQNGGLKSQNHSNAVKKSRESERSRRRRKQKKNKASQATTASGDDSVTAAVNSNGIVNDSFKKDSDAQKALEQVEVEYVPGKAELDDGLNEEFRKVFEKFSFSEGAAEENDKKDETLPDAASKKKADSDSEEEELDTQQKEKGISNKKKKLQRRMKIAELKQICSKA